PSRTDAAGWCHYAEQPQHEHDHQTLRSVVRNTRLLACVQPLDALMITTELIRPVTRRIVFVGLLGIAMIAMAACFAVSTSSRQPAPNQTACDPNNTNCQTTSSGYWGFIF